MLDILTALGLLIWLVVGATLWLGVKMGYKPEWSARFIIITILCGPIPIIIAICTLILELYSRLEDAIANWVTKDKEN